MSTLLDPLSFAILAMDSYSTKAIGAVVGDATIVKQETDPNALAAGFYAVAYQLPDGSIVISYRGTVASSASTLIADILNGWGVGVGDPYSQQAALAIQFYQQVKAAFPGASISVTGHSLGGGLAGFVGSLFGLSGVLFDGMDYALAADVLYSGALAGLAGAQALAQLVYGDGAPWAPNGSGLSAYATSGEILSSGLLGLLGVGAGAEGSGAFLSPGGDVTQIPLVNAFDLHSAALLVGLLYASQEGLSLWQNIGADSSGDSAFLQALFNTSIASALAIKGGASQMLTDIAYSAIPYSALGAGDAPSAEPYGGAALPGLFADADYLGAAVGF